MQMDPPVYSHIARKYGLHVSLLERLYDHEAYDEGVGMLCKTLLTENHRSHYQVCVCVCESVNCLHCHSYVKKIASDTCIGAYCIPYIHKYMYESLYV